MPGNSSVFYLKTKNPLELNICVNKGFSLKQNNWDNLGATNFGVPKKQMMVIEISIITPCTSCMHL